MPGLLRRDRDNRRQAAWTFSWELTTCRLSIICTHKWILIWSMAHIWVSISGLLDNPMALKLPYLSAKRTHTIVAAINFETVTLTLEFCSFFRAPTSIFPFSGAPFFSCAVPNAVDNTSVAYLLCTERKTIVNKYKCVKIELNRSFEITLKACLKVCNAKCSCNISVHTFWHLFKWFKIVSIFTIIHIIFGVLLNEWVHIEYYVFIINAILSFFGLLVVFVLRLFSSHFVANICSFVCLFVASTAHIGTCMVWEGYGSRNQ